MHRRVPERGICRCVDLDVAAPRREDLEDGTVLGPAGIERQEGPGDLPRHFRVQVLPRHPDVVGERRRGPEDADLRRVDPSVLHEALEDGLVERTRVHAVLGHRERRGVVPAGVDGLLQHRGIHALPAHEVGGHQVPRGGAHVTERETLALEIGEGPDVVARGDELRVELAVPLALHQRDHAGALAGLDEGEPSQVRDVDLPLHQRLDDRRVALGNGEGHRPAGHRLQTRHERLRVAEHSRRVRRGNHADPQGSVRRPSGRREEETAGQHGARRRSGHLSGSRPES